MRTRQLFIDLDGVLADFDTAFTTRIGPLPDRNAPGPEPESFWPSIEAIPDFFETLPLMPDAMELWNGAHALHPRPIVLTGSPPKIPIAEAQKRRWVAKHLGADARVICCVASEKRLHGRPGDVLIDDWVRYRPRWTTMGGIFILHTSAATSLAEARGYFDGQ